MGQQQLLLLVLGIVIVGLSVVVGIQAFSENQKKANVDALLLTAMGIAVDAQVWLQTPEVMGGGLPATGGRLLTFNSVTVELSDLGYPTNASDEYRTVDGTFTVTDGGAQFVVIGRSASTSGAGDNNLVCVVATGVRLEDITTEINPASNSC